MIIKWVCVVLGTGCMFFIFTKDRRFDGWLDSFFLIGFFLIFCMFVLNLISIAPK
ncbi:MAG: hypothetical protein WC306_01095 [Candidatus Paceibacterota bacterium]